jgi:hypothetical protein
MKLHSKGRLLNLPVYIRGGVAESSKRSSLLRHGIDYDRKKFYRIDSPVRLTFVF